ncbi:MAG: bifunctional folylpolyglutamate synthase/dihydrofolate synthase [Eubacteriales bacterium]
MTYSETLAWMHSMPRIRTAPTLSRMERLLDMLGNPEKKLAGRFLHVTGTNGKGSVCAFLTSALRRQGYRVGRFISPFIMEFRERMEIDGVRISEEAVTEIGARLQACVNRFTQETGETPLEFELVTLMGLIWFAEQNCGLVVTEVGIGGLTDATNVITPLLSVITRVDYDHTELLGGTLTAIAEQKSGIIKHGAPCVLYADNEPEVKRVIETRCRAVGSPLIVPDIASLRIGNAEPGFLPFSYRDVPYTLGLSGLYQAQNAITAIEALRLLPSLGYPVSEEAVRTGLAETVFPARFEVLTQKPLIILDGAHNASGMHALADNIRYYFPGKPLFYLCGMLGDKHPKDALAPVLTPETVRFAACITPPTPRAMPAETLSRVFSENGIPARPFPSAADAIAFLRQAAGTDASTPILCFGSLYSAGDIRRACGK